MLGISVFGRLRQKDYCIFEVSMSQSALIKKKRISKQNPLRKQEEEFLPDFDNEPKVINPLSDKT